MRGLALKVSCRRHPRPHASTAQGGPSGMTAHSLLPTYAHHLLRFGLHLNG